VLADWKKQLSTPIHEVLKNCLWVNLPVIATVMCLSVPSFADEESWKKEYNKICGKRHEAVSLSEEDLVNRVRQCNDMLNTIEESDYPRKKIFIFRFEKCRNFYQYLMDAKKGGDQ
jgi:hypothetical protein